MAIPPIKDRLKKVIKKAPIGLQGTGASFTRDGVPIVSNDNAGNISDLYGASSGGGAGGYDGTLSGQQKLQKDRFMETRGVLPDGQKTTSVSDFTSGMVQQKTSGMSNIPDYSPPQAADGADPKDTALQRALYDLSYTKQALGASMQETDSIRKGVGSQQEQDLVEDAQKMERVNPEFAKLTENEKKLNQQRKDVGESFIPELIDMSSGRSGLDKRQSREQKQASSWLANNVSKLGNNALETIKANLDIMTPSQKAVARDYIRTQEAQRQQETTQQISQQVASEIKAKEKKIRADLNLSDQDILTFGANGEPLINGKTEPQRAIDRAKADIRKQRDDYLSDFNKKKEEEMAYIRSTHTVDGNLTEKGRQELAEYEREADEERDENLKKIDESLQEYVNKQESRQASVDLDNAQSNSIESQVRRQMAQDEANGAYNIQMQYAQLGTPMGFETALKEYKKRQAFVETQTESDSAEVLDSKIFTPNFDRTQTLAIATDQFSGDVSKAEAYMKSRGFTTGDIKAQKQQYQIDTLGYSPEDVKEAEDAISFAKLEDQFFTGTIKPEDTLLFFRKTESSSKEGAIRDYELALREGIYKDNPILENNIQLRLASLKGATGTGYTSNKSFDDIMYEMKVATPTRKSELIAELQAGGRFDQYRKYEQEIMGDEFAYSNLSMAQLPSTIRNSNEEREWFLSGAKYYRELGYNPYEAADAALGFIIEDEKNKSIANTLRRIYTTSPTSSKEGLQTIGRNINDGQLGFAITATENAVIPAESDFGVSATENIIRQTQEIKSLIGEVGSDFMGSIDSRMFDMSKGLTTSDFEDLLDDVGIKDKEKRMKAVRLGGMLAKLMAEDRRSFGGTALTKNEAAFMTPFLTDMREQPNVALEKIKLIEDGVMRQYNSLRKAYMMPDLVAPEVIDSDLKIARYNDYAEMYGGNNVPQIDKPNQMRTDRHNNPTAIMWTSGVSDYLTEKGYDVKKGDAFPNNPNAFTIDMSGVDDPVKLTIDYIDGYGFQDPSGNPRWSHTNIDNSLWGQMSESQKRQIIQKMYNNEGVDSTLGLFNFNNNGIS